MNELCDNIGPEDSFSVNEGKRCQGVKTSLSPLGRDWTRYSRKMNSLLSIRIEVDMEIKDKYMLTTKRNKINLIDYWMLMSVKRSWFMIVTIAKYTINLDVDIKFYKQLLNALYGRGDLLEVWRDVLEREGNTSLPEKF